MDIDILSGKVKVCLSLMKKYLDIQYDIRKHFYKKKFPKENVEWNNKSNITNDSYSRYSQ